MNIWDYNKRLRNIRVSVKILLAFLFVCCGLTAISGFVYYRNSQNTIIESIKNQASLLCEHAEHEFISQYSKPVDKELKLLETSPQLNSYLMSSQQESFMYHAEVEKLFFIFFF